MSQQDFREEYNPYAPPTAGTEASGRLFGDEPEADDEQIPAGVWTRFGARWVDNFIVFLTALPAVIAYATQRDNGGAQLALLLGVLPAALMIYQCYLVATTGQSLAKKWMRIRIVKTDGSPVGFFSGVLLREWVVLGLGAIPTIGSIFSFIDAVMIFGAERRCLHDRISSTKVILVIPRA